MSKNDGTGLADALNLDQAAEELREGSDSARASGGENLDLFGDPADKYADFGVLGAPRDIEPRSTGGRPKGSRNKVTADIVKMIEAAGRNPLLAMAEVCATPIPVLARQLECSALEAAEFWRKVNSDLASYVAQKQPTAIAIAGANAGKLTVIDFSGIAAMAGNNAEYGLPMKVIEQNAQTVEDLGLNDEKDAQSHDNQSHEGDK